MPEKKPNRPKMEMMSNEAIMAEFARIKDEVKDRYPIDQAITDLTSARLRKTGRTYEALCPFHQERTPSFKVDPGRGNYRCWGCGEKGDAIELIQTTQNLDFQGAVLFAADKVGISVPEALRTMVAKRGGPKGAVRKQVRYASSQVHTTPETLGNPQLLVIPEGAPRPAANSWFPLWNNGGAYGDKEFDAKRYKAEMVHEYRSIDGEHLMSILRVRGRDRKFFIPARLMKPAGDCPKGMLLDLPDSKGVAWVSLGPRAGEAKPVYGMEDVRAWLAAGGRHVLLVEGEKTRDAAARMLKAADPEGKWLVLTPMGGSKSSIWADWEPFFAALDRTKRYNIVQWPDADHLLKRPDGSIEDRQAIAVQQMQSVVAQWAIDKGMIRNVTLGHITPPKDTKSGWDIADAEVEGWTPDALLQYIKKNSRKTKMDALELRDEGKKSSKSPAGREEPGTPAPFDQAHPKHG